MFSSVESAPPIEIFELTKRCREDTFEKKVDLGVGGKFSYNDIDQGEIIIY